MSRRTSPNNASFRQNPCPADRPMSALGSDTDAMQPPKNCWVPSTRVWRAAPGSQLAYGPSTTSPGVVDPGEVWLLTAAPAGGALTVGGATGSPVGGRRRLADVVRMSAHRHQALRLSAHGRARPCPAVSHLENSARHERPTQCRPGPGSDQRCPSRGASRPRAFPMWTRLQMPFTRTITASSSSTTGTRTGQPWCHASRPAGSPLSRVSRRKPSSPRAPDRSIPGVALGEGD